MGSELPEMATVGVQSRLQKLAGGGKDELASDTEAEVGAELELIWTKTGDWGAPSSGVAAEQEGRECRAGGCQRRGVVRHLSLGVAGRAGAERELSQSFGASIHAQCMLQSRAEQSSLARRNWTRANRDSTHMGCAGKGIKDRIERGRTSCGR